MPFPVFLPSAALFTHLFVVYMSPFEPTGKHYCQQLSWCGRSEKSEADRHDEEVLHPGYHHSPEFSSNSIGHAKSRRPSV